MPTIGIRELKAHLSAYLARVKQGERIVITDRGRAIAVIGPAAESDLNERIAEMLRTGRAHWNGGKPSLPSRRIRLKGGPTLSESILEDRR